MSGLEVAADAGDDNRARHLCEQLERGEILFFARPPFDFPEDDRRFLLNRRRGDSAVHKNVSYRPAEDRLVGFEGEAGERERLHRILRDYSARVTAFVSGFLRPYAGRLQLDFASFRPFQEAGRKLPLHKRNDLLHVDAFPSRPTRGGRILRVFTNIHDAEPRTWHTGEPFPALARRLAVEAGVNRFARQRHPWRRLARSLGIPLADRSPYDSFMLRFHDYLKENTAYQENCPKQRLEFPPMSTWMVYTDGVPHAALSGQFALEQTFIVPLNALVTPAQAPIRVLEQLCGRALA